MPDLIPAKKPIITGTEAGKRQNPAVPTPIYKKSTVRFPTTREIELAVAEINHEWDQAFPLVDRFFGVDTTFATSIEAYVTRIDKYGRVGMTFPSNLETEARTFDFGQKVDMAKMYWSPARFKEGKRWGEREILEKGRLADDVAYPETLSEIADWYAVMKQRMQNRRLWLCQQVILTGKIQMTSASQDNPDRIAYNIDFGFTDFTVNLPIKFDQKNGSGISLQDPVQWALDYNKSQRYKSGRQLVEIITNSNFIEVLADNTHIRNYIHLMNAVQNTNAFDYPRAYYMDQALEVFKRYSKLEVTLVDDTYEDATGQAQYWMPDGQMILVLGNTGQIGKFVYTAHLHGGGGENINIGTGEFLFVNNQMKRANPYFELIGGFNGFPKIEGYELIDPDGDATKFGFHRIKRMTYTSAAIPGTVPLPKQIDVSVAL
jgi:Phage major capsid protein E